MKHLLATLALLVMLTGCAKNVTTPTPGISDHALQVTSKAVLDIAQATGGVQASIIAANSAGLASDATTKSILLICQKINGADQEASKVIRSLQVLAPADRGKLDALLTPILAAVNDSIATGLIGITDPNTRTQVQAGLTAIQVALSGVRVALAGGN